MCTVACIMYHLPVDSGESIIRTRDRSYSRTRLDLLDPLDPDLFDLFDPFDPVRSRTIFPLTIVVFSRRESKATHRTAGLNSSR